MPSRIVVVFLTRLGSRAVAAGGDVYVKRVTELCKKAEALGGRVCAFGSQSVAFDFAEDELEEAIFLALGERRGSALAPEDGALGPWRMGLAEGAMSSIGHDGARTRLAWGPPLVRAVALARIAHPDELLIDPEVDAVRRGQIRTLGERTAHDPAKGVRGLIVDSRHALADDASEAPLTRLARPALVGHQASLQRILEAEEPLALIRADPGFGGTRLLAEIHDALLPAPSLLLCSAGAEPLGALRSAFARSVTVLGPGALNALSIAHRRGLDRLLSGEGLDIGLAARLIERWLTAFGSTEAPPGFVLVDDATDVDDPSLDVVVSAARLVPGRLRVVARIDVTSVMPPSLQRLELGPTVHLGALPRSSAEDLAASAAQGTLSSEAARRWARRGRFVPLGIVEALAVALATGELAPAEGSSSSQRGVERATVSEAKDFIERRLRLLPPSATQALRAVAILGVETRASLAEQLGRALRVGGLLDQVEKLTHEGWLVAKPDGFCELPSRTHRAVILDDIPAVDRPSWHGAASRVIEEGGGRLASAEAARHAALAGDSKRAVDLALVAAKASQQVELDAATEALLAFAGATTEDIAQLPEPPPDFRLSTWVEALRTGGDRDGGATRLEAIASLAKGDASSALVALRQGVHLAENAPPAARSRASLAYGIALAIAGQPVEALFAGLDALARAREGEEPRGERACARFLARLTTAAGYGEKAREWEGVAGEGLAGEGIAGRDE